MTRRSSRSYRRKRRTSRKRSGRRNSGKSQRRMHGGFSDGSVSGLSRKISNVIFDLRKQLRSGLPNTNSSTQMYGGGCGCSKGAGNSFTTTPERKIHFGGYHTKRYRLRSSRSNRYF